MNMTRSSILRRVAASAGVALLGAQLFAPAAFADDNKDKRERDTPRQEFRYRLASVPHDPNVTDSRAKGKATITREGDRVTVALKVKGLSPDLVHVQHIHGVGQNEFPGPEARNRRIADGLIDTVEGLPEYGPVTVSLTTSGDTSPASTLAVDRFPTADENGKVRYERTFTVGADFPRAVADDLTKFHIVVHGIDVNYNGFYDFSYGVSGLNPAVPLEADLPATCGLEQHAH